MKWLTLNNSLRRRCRWRFRQSHTMTKKNKKCSRLMKIMAKKKSKLNNQRTSKDTVRSRPMAKNKLMVKRNRL